MITLYKTQMKDMPAQGNKRYLYLGLEKEGMWLSYRYLLTYSGGRINENQKYVIVHCMVIVVK